MTSRQPQTLLRFIGRVIARAGKPSRLCYIMSIVMLYQRDKVASVFFVLFSIALALDDISQFLERWGS